jgi:TRAP-type C4-dicarboxylate transport system substrate-binding protein
MRFAFLFLLASSAALGDEQILRIGTIVPAGTGWARGIRTMAREVEADTGGSVKMKIYMGGIAGDEVEMLERLRRGQLDGVLSGSVACETAAPSLRVVRIPGLLQTWSETSYVVGQLRPLFDDEAKRNGFTYLGEAIVGPSILFTRTPVHDLADLKKLRLWIWDIDRMLGVFLPAMGLPVVPTPIRDALRAYEDDRVDGFVSPAVVALAFQWSPAARYFTDLRLGFVAGCLVVANRAFDELSLPDQQSLAGAAAKTLVHMDEVGRDMDAQLLGGLFERQGLHQVPVTSTLQVEYDVSAVRARAELMAQHRVDAELVGKVEQMLVEIRAHQAHR